MSSYKRQEKQQGVAVHSASQSCLPLHGPHHWVACLPAFFLSTGYLLCHQPHTDIATAISRAGASPFFGTRSQQTRLKCWERVSWILESFRGPVEPRSTLGGSLSCFVECWQVSGEQRVGGLVPSMSFNWKTQKQQLAATWLAVYLALPCTSLLTRLLIWQPALS